MKRLMTIVLAALLSLSIASVSLAQTGGGTGGASETPTSHTKKHKKKHHKKSKKKQTPAAGEGTEQK